MPQLNTLKDNLAAHLKRPLRLIFAHLNLVVIEILVRMAFPFSAIAAPNSVCELDQKTELVGLSEVVYALIRNGTAPGLMFYEALTRKDQAKLNTLNRRYWFLGIQKFPDSDAPVLEKAIHDHYSRLCEEEEHNECSRN